MLLSGRELLKKHIYFPNLFVVCEDQKEKKKVSVSAILALYALDITGMFPSIAQP